MRKPLTRLLHLGLAVLFMAAPGSLTRGQQGSATAPSKHMRGQFQQEELQNQHRRLKESRKDVQSEARQLGHHPAPPKAGHHKMIKVQNHSKIENANLHQARKENRSRRAVVRKPQPN